MDRIKCCIVKDLMPLYIDDVLSEDSACEIQDHLRECESCRAEYQMLKKDLVLPMTRKVQEENSRVLKNFKRKWTKKQIMISVVSAVLAVILFFPVLDGIAESELFQPTTRACAGQVGQLYLGELSDGAQWTRLYLIKEKLFSNVTAWNEPYLVFDNPFYQEKAVNSANSATTVELRFLDVEGNVVLGPVVIEPGMAVPIEELKRNTPYIVEYRAAGDYYAFTFY